MFANIMLLFTIINLLSWSVLILGFFFLGGHWINKKYKLYKI